ncbi:MAG: hypothetical protein II839_04650 [Kiritimatiellae bacterium]|nr:hypothetical protein [Kiritimatiellia bacterium]
MTPEQRGEKAAQLKKSGSADCCQSVLLACADVPGKVLCECSECCRNAMLAAEDTLA